MTRPLVMSQGCRRLGAMLLFLTLAACTPGTGLSLHDAEVSNSKISSPAIIANLQGTRWMLQSYGPADRPVAVLDEPTVTAEFTSDQKLHGMAGCNTYATSFVIDGNTIALDDLRRTPFGCPDELAWKQETSFLEALSSAQAISVEGDALAITYSGGKLLFAPESSLPAISLTGRQWRLIAFETGHTILPPLSGTMITAEFTGGRISGLAGCNSYTGTYVQAGQEITVIETVVTAESCLAAGVMAQEAAYLAALRSAKSVTAETDFLTINYEGGVLIFTAGGTAHEAPATAFENRNLR